MSKNESKLTTKLSPLIEGQVPDFVQSDHPVFVRFLKQYYQYLEAGRLTLDTPSIDNIIQETETSSYILFNASDGANTDAGDRVVAESGSGTTSKFTDSETVTGGTSKATATVLLQDIRNDYLYISSQQKFITGETITGATSGATAKIKEYRANPIQNIQQLLEYANTDNTIYDFLDQFRNSFMNAIPNTLASGVSKRNLIKNIKDLYAAKGTSEGHKLFMRMLFAEESEIIYPNEYMMRSSDGDWGTKTTIRVTASTGVAGREVENQIITGQTSGATATVETSLSFIEGSGSTVESITEFQIVPISGTFVDGEIVTGVSNTRDVTVKFTVQSIFSSITINNDGILHSVDEPLTIETIGNGAATATVKEIIPGSISGVEVSVAGNSYEVGDTLTFTASTADTDAVSASGFVSMVGGGIQQESGTLDDPTITTDTITIEDGTQTHLEPFKFILENILEDRFTGDGTTKEFTLTNLNASTDTLYITIDDVVFVETSNDGTANWSASGTTLTFTTAPSDDAKIYVRGNEVNDLLLDRTAASGTNIDIGHQILTEEEIELEDTHTTDTDQIVLESATFSATESHSLQKVYVADGGGGYTSLPSITITTTTGSTGELLAVTNDIGAIKSIQVTNTGFDYTTSNVPDVTPRAHFVLKNVSGTFTAENTLTSHVGTVKGFDSDTNVLDTTFENVIRIEQEQTSTFNDSMGLEDANVSTSHELLLLEDEQDFDDGENIILDGTGTTTPTPKTYIKKVTVVRNATDTANIFAIDSVAQPTLRLTEGNTYYFDLSDSSLYNAVSTKNHQLRFSTTSDGTHGSGSAYTTGVTTSASYVDIGTTGAYIQIVVATGAPTLYYYCVNHSGMGGKIFTPTPVTTIDDLNDNLILDGIGSFERKLLTENATASNNDLGVLRFETTKNIRPTNIVLDGSASGVDSDGFSKIQLESGVISQGNFFIIAEDEIGFVDVENFDNLLGDEVLLESSNAGLPVNSDGDKVLIDRYRERPSVDNYFLLDGIDSDGTASGDRLLSENSGVSINLEGTDSDGSDKNDTLLFENETGNGDILLDGSDSSSTDAGDNIINEEPIDFSLKNVTITDSAGASGTIVKADIATLTGVIDTTSTSIGSYTGIQSLLGQDLNRIQDSYYYQDYSYEIKIGQAFASYINELKKAVHPTGFQPFGKVSIASVVSVAVTNAGSDLTGFTGDDRFSPILASTFETIFDQVIKSRLEVAPDGDRGDRDDTIILNGTDSTSSNASDNILFEGNAERNTNEDGGGRVMSETSHAPSGKAERVLVKRTTVDISTRPTVRTARNLLLQLAQNPFGGGASSLQLENSSSGSFESGNLVLDGMPPLNDDTVPILLEGDEDLDHIVLNGTDGSSSNAGDNILTEAGSRILNEDQGFVTRGAKDRVILENSLGNGLLFAESDNFAFPVGFIVNQNDKMILEDDHDDTSLDISSISDLTFSDILETNKIIITDEFGRDVEQNNANAIENTGVLLENFGQLLLDGTDSDSTNANSFLIQQTDKRNRFTLELSGNIIEEDISSNSILEYIIDHDSNDIVLENALGSINVDSILLEQGDGDDSIILDGTDNNQSFAGYKLELETSGLIDNPNIALETNVILANEGQIPFANWTLNSSANPVGVQPVVKSSEIVVRTTGDIALEDETAANSYLLIDRTNSTGSDAGDNFDLEGATGITV